MKKLAFWLLLIGLASLAPAQTQKKVHLKQTKAGKWAATANFVDFGKSTAVAKLASETLSSDIRKDMAEFVKFCNEDPNQPRASSWEYELNTDVTYKSPNLISFVTTTYSYAGGAHPNTYMKSYVFGLVSGKAKLLRLSDIVKKGYTAQYVIDYVGEPALQRAKREKSPELELDPGWEIPNKVWSQFSVDKRGLTWNFSPYDVGSYAEGPYMVELGWGALKEYIDPKGPLKPLFAGR